MLSLQLYILFFLLRIASVPFPSSLIFFKTAVFMVCVIP